MAEYQYIALREQPEWMQPAAEWFHCKWGVPTEAYLECIESYLHGETELGWFLCLDGDQIVYNRKILSPEFERSGYNSIWTESETDEWLQQVEDGIVVSCSRNGGKGGWQLYSISRWSKEDGKRLKHHLEVEFEEKKNRQIYWDDVAMFCYPKEYRLGIRPMQPGDLIEVDNLEELIALDNSYRDLYTKKE